jgi:uncharacterized membrane protein YfcA
MHIDLYVAVAGLIVGFVVGLTGMGGGALMTPILVLLFKVEPLAAVSSDLVAALVMKPVGGAVHLRRGTVNLRLVRWLMIGSVPSAFCGVLVLRALGNSETLQNRLKVILGVVLIVASISMVVKGIVDARRRSASAGSLENLSVKPVPTILIGALGGLVVGMTSVGSGSIIIILLLVLYPALNARSLVGTDLVQAVPLVAAAALGHIIFGDFQLGLTSSILIGSMPGVYLGARVSSRAPDRLVRQALVFVLLASGLKLVNLGTVELAWVLAAVAVAVFVAKPAVTTALRRAFAFGGQTQSEVMDSGFFRPDRRLIRAWMWLMGFYLSLVRPKLVAEKEAVPDPTGDRPS